MKSSVKIKVPRSKKREESKAAAQIRVLDGLEKDEQMTEWTKEMSI